MPGQRDDESDTEYLIRMGYLSYDFEAFVEGAREEMKAPGVGFAEGGSSGTTFVSDEVRCDASGSSSPAGKVPLAFLKRSGNRPAFATSDTAQEQYLLENIEELGLTVLGFLGVETCLGIRSRIVEWQKKDKLEGIVVWQEKDKLVAASGEGHPEDEPVAEQKPERTSGRGVILRECMLPSCNRREALRKQFQVCSGCMAKVYCRKECQKQDWVAGHRRVCKK